MKHFTTFFLAAALAVGCLTSCGKTLSEKRAEANTRSYLNQFSYSLLSGEYLWTADIYDALSKWDLKADPYDQVLAARYKDGSGKEIDRWTQMFGSFDAVMNSMDGTPDATFGMELGLRLKEEGSRQVVAEVLYTYAGSPAREAGLKRGDVIVEINGIEMDVDNYSMYLSLFLSAVTQVTLTLADGRDVLVFAESMYLDPVLLSKVFQADGKKVGYLCYTSFTLDSYEALIKACKEFRQEGVKDLILDLRYNTGGYALAELVLASMLAPEGMVRMGAVHSKDVYNAAMTTYLQQNGEDMCTRFQQEFAFQGRDKTYRFSTADANVGCERIIALVGPNTASASELLLCALKPYMPVYLIGTQTYGKYCTGIMVPAEDFYEEAAKQGAVSAKDAEDARKYTADKGMYLMISYFTDKNGATLCMPDGMAPDEQVEDNPGDGFELGDPGETLLARALAYCGYRAAPAQAQRAGAVRPPLAPFPGAPVRNTFLVRTDIPRL